MVSGPLRLMAALRPADPQHNSIHKTEAIEGIWIIVFCDGARALLANSSCCAAVLATIVSAILINRAGAGTGSKQGDAVIG